LKIAFAADHRGLALKNYLAAAARELGHEPVDFGTYDDLSCDYVDFGLKAAQAVVKDEADRGVLVCATGIGMSIAANKIPGVRAALCWTIYMARLTRLHNNANVLVLSGDQTAFHYGREILKVWLETPFEGGRHERRVAKIKEIEDYYSKK